VLDACSRRVVGWAMAEHLRTELVIEAVEMALWRRRPAGIIHHSDQGSQYTSLAFGRRLREAGMTASMGSRGDCFDNAMAESFFATLECELLARRSFPTGNAARLALFDYIEGFYNTHRRHSALDYLSPCAYERRWTAEGLYRLPVNTSRIAGWKAYATTKTNESSSEGIGISRVVFPCPLRRGNSKLYSSENPRREM
jgi:putative transposase